jgi:capsule biosynthesis phosphatase
MLPNTRTIVIDIDDTICKPNHKETDSYKKYGEAEPIIEVIESMKVARKKGFKIILSTARRMVTHDGDIIKIIEDVGKITEEWLEKHEVPYDEIQFGKPYGIWYVDDKSLTPEEFVYIMAEDYDE